MTLLNIKTIVQVDRVLRDKPLEQVPHFDYFGCDTKYRYETNDRNSQQISVNT